jgi:primosomal protein N' (replication factor Y)
VSAATARVAVFLPVPKLFDYAVPSGMTAEVGARVWVPWGSRSVEGVVVARDAPDAPPSLRSLVKAVDAPPIGPDLMALAAWIGEYYLAPPGEVLRLMLPAGGRARVRRIAALTDEGRRAAQALSSALEPVALAELAPRERTVLGALLDGEMDADALEQAIAGAPAALRLLGERGLVTVDERVSTPGRKEEIWLRPGRPLVGGELARAPRRAEVHAQIVAAGLLSLAELRAADPRAIPHVAALKEAGLVEEERREVSRDPFAALTVERSAPPVLTAAQAAALATIEPALTRGQYAPFVLHGVTGSGKTEVYLRAIERTLGLGKRALVLVPEISLTPQLAARFAGRFGSQVAVLHSGLADSARKDAFRRIQRGEVAIALGARSAVFAPVDQLGIVIVDEEHDPSFKQEEGVRYHGRDVALVRARAAGAVALLGSATPSIETFAAAKDGRLGLIELPERATARPLPSVEVVDLKQHRTGDGPFSAALVRALESTLAAGEQAILFLNRRGFSTFILCKGCGQAQRCRDCSVTLTYHRRSDQLVCHYCGFRTAPPRTCSACGARDLERLGFGTEQIEARLKDLLPTARVARLDRDSAQGDGLQRILDGLRRHELDVVVGTQMITKGHDFPNVTLVGVILADQGMGLPDFRASERTFQLLEQVAGRAGRGERAGRVLVQTFNPLHVAVTCARDHDYARFFELELAARRELGYPPSARLGCVRLDGADPLEVRTAAEAAAAAARAACARAPVEEEAGVLGPAEAPLSRLKGRTRWQLFVRARGARALRVIARAAATVSSRSVRASVDIDPISML